MERIQVIDSSTKKKDVLRLFRGVPRDFKKDDIIQIIRYPGESGIAGWDFTRLIITKDKWYLGTSDHIKYISEMFYNLEKYKEILPAAEHIKEAVLAEKGPDWNGLICFYMVANLKTGKIIVLDQLEQSEKSYQFLINENKDIYKKIVDRAVTWRRKGCQKYVPLEQTKRFVEYLNIPKIEFPEIHTYMASALPKEGQRIIYCYRFLKKAIKEDDITTEDILNPTFGGLFLCTVDRKWQRKMEGGTYYRNIIEFPETKKALHSN